MPCPRYPRTKETENLNQLECKKKGKWSRPGSKRIYRVTSLQERALEDGSRWRRAGAAPNPSYSASRPPPAVGSWRSGTRAATMRSKRNTQLPVRSSSNDAKTHKNPPASAGNWLDPGMREGMLDSLCCSRQRPSLPACRCRRKKSHARYTRAPACGLVTARVSSPCELLPAAPSAQLASPGAGTTRHQLVRSPLSYARREKERGRKEMGLGFGVSGGRWFYSTRDEPWPLIISVWLRSCQP